MSIDREKLSELLDNPIRSAGMSVEEIQDLLDAIVGLAEPKPDVADTGTIFPEIKPPKYAGGYHFPQGLSPGHPLVECNRRLCGPRL